MSITLTRGDVAVTVGPNGGETVTIVRAEYLNHPAFGDTPARRERWLHIRFADGARLLAHPSNLTRSVGYATQRALFAHTDATAVFECASDACEVIADATAPAHIANRPSHFHAAVK